MFKIYIGNLDNDATLDHLKQLLSAFTDMEDLVLVTDPETGKSRCFAIAMFRDQMRGQLVIETLNGKSLLGRPLVVNEAVKNRKGLPPKKEPGRGRGGPGGSGGGGGRFPQRGGSGRSSSRPFGRGNSNRDYGAGGSGGGSSGRGPLGPGSLRAGGSSGFSRSQPLRPQQPWRASDSVPRRDVPSAGGASGPGAAPRPGFQRPFGAPGSRPPMGSGGASAPGRPASPSAGSGIGRAPSVPPSPPRSPSVPPSPPRAPSTPPSPPTSPAAADPSGADDAKPPRSPAPSARRPSSRPPSIRRADSGGGAKPPQD